MVLMQDYQEIEILKGLLEGILSKKSEIQTKFTLKEQNIFNRLMTTLLMMLEIDKVDVGQVKEKIHKEILKPE